MGVVLECVHCCQRGQKFVDMVMTKKDNKIVVKTEIKISLLDEPMQKASKTQQKTMSCS